MMTHTLQLPEAAVASTLVVRVRASPVGDVSRTPFQPQARLVVRIISDVAHCGSRILLLGKRQTGSLFLYHRAAAVLQRRRQFMTEESSNNCCRCKPLLPLMLL